MDHSHHDSQVLGHSDMGHSHIGMDMPHGGGGGGTHAPMCSMNMLFTWDTTNLCVVFRSWQVTGLGSLIGTLIAIVLLTAGYEALRELARRYEARAAARADGGLEHSHTHAIHDNPYEDEHSSLLAGGGGAAGGNSLSTRAHERQVKIIKALFYGVQVFYSFFIMLLFMTYNGWIMIAVGVGAFLGYLLFAGSPATKAAACH